MSIQSISSVSTPMPQVSGARPAGSASIDTASPPATAAAPAIVRPAQTNAGSGQTQRQAQVEQSEIRQALEEVRAALSPVAQNLRFSIDDDTGRMVIRIIDSSTDEVIKQIPSEEIIAIAKALDKFQGLLVRQQA